MASLTNTILDNAWGSEHIPGKKNEDNCSGFLYSLLDGTGVFVPIGLNADGMIDYFENSESFTSLGKGNEALKTAYQYALNSKVVIVGAKSGELGQNHGHVAIVLGKGGADNPYIFGGSLGGAKSNGNKQLSQIFRRTHFDILRYFLAL